MFKNFSLKFAVIFVGILGVGFQAYGQWQERGKAYTCNGLETTDIAVGYQDGTKIIYVVDGLLISEMYGDIPGNLYKSENDCEIWETPSTFADLNPTCVVCKPNNAEVVYIGRSSGVWKSTDRGITWTQMVTGLTNFRVQCLSMDPQNPDVIYAGCVGSPSLFKTTDGGNTWVVITEFYAIATVFRNIKIDPTDPNKVFVSIDGGLLEEGVWKGEYTPQTDVWTWEWKLSGKFPSIVIDPVDGNNVYVGNKNSSDILKPVGIYKSIDGGDNWNLLPNAPEGAFSMIIPDPTNTQVIYASASGLGMYMSLDGGGTWSERNNGIQDKYTLLLDYDPLNPDILYGGTRHTFCKSNDGGVSWTEKNEGMKILPLYKISAKFPVIYGTPVSAGIVYKTDNRGETWKCMKNIIVGGEGTPPWTVAVDPTNSDKVFCASECNLFGMHFFRSNNGGVDWEKTWDDPSGIENFISPLNFVFDPGNTDIIYVTGTGRDPHITKSIDGGDTWDAWDWEWDLVDKTDIGVLLSIAVDPFNSSVVYSFTLQNAVCKSVDEGATWVPKNNGLPYPISEAYKSKAKVIMDYFVPNVLYATTHQGVYKSEDGGDNWSLLNPNMESLILNPSVPGVMYGVDDAENIYHSFDNGNSWTDITAGLPSGLIISRLILDPDAPDTLYASTGDGFRYLYDITPLNSDFYGAAAYNNQRSIETDQNNNLHTVYFVSDKIYYANSIDDGGTWPKEIIGEGKYPALALDNDGINVCWFSDDGVHYRRKDASGWGEDYLIFPKSDNWIGTTSISVSGNSIYIVLQDIKYRIPDADIHSVRCFSFPINDPLNSQIVLIDSWYATGPPWIDASPSIALDGGLPHICWEKDNKIYHRFFTGWDWDDIDNWSDKFLVSDVSQEAHHPSIDVWKTPCSYISLYERGNVWIAFEADDKIYTRKGNIRTSDIFKNNISVIWDDAPICVTPATTGGDYPVIIGQQIMWCQNGIDIWHANFDGSDWSGHENLTADKTVSYKHPQITLETELSAWGDLDKAHLHWVATRGEDVPYEIKYDKIEDVSVKSLFSGHITENTTLQTDLYLTGDVTIAPEVTLTVNPGVTMYFCPSDDQDTGQDNTVPELEVYGTLIADSAQFLISSENGKQYWRIETFGADASATFTDCSIGHEGDLLFCSNTGTKSPQINEERLVYTDNTDKVDLAMPKVFKFSQNEPNPFFKSTNIKYQIPVKSRVSLKIYDITGRCVKTLIDNEKEIGYYKVKLDAKEFSAGIYFMKFFAKDGTENGTKEMYKETKKLILLK